MRNFLLDEFACGCGCGLVTMSKTFLDQLDMARDLAGVPFCITSGVRCAEHNAKVGGVSKSRHLSGEAADICTDGQEHRGRILIGLYAAGFTSIAIHPAFIHVDCHEQPWCGLYKTA